MVDIEIYSDEIIEPYDFKNKRRRFLGIACLFIPVNERENLIRDLLNLRCIKNKSWRFDNNNCRMNNECNSNYHQTNNCEIHHINIRNSRAKFALRKISRRWIDYFCDRNMRNVPLKYNIIFIDLEKLHIKDFGKDKNLMNIYNKFFRTAINYGLKAFFNNERVNVKRVYHDNGSMKCHQHFPLLNLNKLNEELNGNYQIENCEIEFVESDHKYYIPHNLDMAKKAQIIQMTDLILGLVTQNIYYLSDDSLRKENAMLIRGGVSSIIRNRFNRNKSYYGNQNISFFPEISVETTVLSNLEGEHVNLGRLGKFHYNKEIEMPDLNQKSLSKWT